MYIFIYLHDKYISIYMPMICHELTNFPMLQREIYRLGRRGFLKSLERRFWLGPWGASEAFCENSSSGNP